MNILIIHNHYIQYGGEDVVFEQETRLLIKNHHHVVTFTRNNRDISNYSNLSLALNTLWNKETYGQVRNIIRNEQIDIVHIHNTFPIISPSVIYAAQSLRVPVVQTLHNFRLVCANALLYRNSSICEKCLGKFIPYPAVQYRCYHNSLLHTTSVVCLQLLHRLMGTWQKQVDRFIALSAFSRHKMIQAGLPQDKIVIKPNFIENDPGMRDTGGEYAVFIGRLAAEKGILTLLKAWEKLPHVPLRIIGAGPLQGTVEEASHRYPAISYLGFQNRETIFKLLKNARFLILPSSLYENFPITLIEAFACGVPVITSNVGVPSEIVQNNIHGLLYQAGNADELAQVVRHLWENPHISTQMGIQARLEYENKYSADKNYACLLKIYEDVIHQKRNIAY